ncbi:hypothetical protein [Streptomyces violaceusniger]|uniref:hypothetical protein n=1 Tax=Streptomyces violaceusniger TaxID=68280 RepID=UPI0009C30853|nr:hypothetical protein [Streptomyces hygroscopicus]AQW46719.1 hypothetical protein SHXM_00182 [Streptomyces hygroscopicus]
MERRYERVTIVQDASHQMLVSEMAVTSATLPRATEQLRGTLPHRLKHVEGFLNRPR